jgi:hypothetical protein
MTKCDVLKESVVKPSVAEYSEMFAQRQLFFLYPQTQLTEKGV